MEIGCPRLSAPFIRLIRASECVSQLGGVVTLALSIKTLVGIAAPVGVLRKGHIPLGQYTLPGSGLCLSPDGNRLAICITLFILNHYKCLFLESSEDVSRRYFVIVRSKTTINAV